MASKAQLKKKFADELAASSAPGPLLHVIYALSKDASLQGSELVTFEGYRGKRPAGRQIALAKSLLGIKTKKKAPKKVKSKNGRREKAANGRKKQTTSTDPAYLVREAIKGYQAILNGAKKEKARLKRDYDRAMRALDQGSKDARTQLAKLRKAGIK